MRRIFALLLAIVMVFSLAACGNKADKDTTNPTVTEPSEDSGYAEEQVPTDAHGPSELEKKYVVDADGKLTNIRNNGYLPTNKKDLTDDEFYYHLGEVIDAAIKLDIDTLSKYGLRDDVLQSFKDIKNDEDHLNMYKNTIGNVIYLKGSHYFVFKDPFYTYSRWYADQKATGGKTIAAQLTKDEIDAVYSKYYQDAPYIVEKANDYNFDYTLNGGNIYFNLDNILEIIGYKSVGDLTPDAPFNYANFVFGNNRDSVTDIGSSGKPASREILDIIASCNLDKMVEYIENNESYDLNYANKEAVYDDCYQLYYKNDELRAKIQSWMNDNVETYKSDFGVVTYVKANIAHRENWPFNMFKEHERDAIKDLPISVKFATYEIGEMAEWGQYYIIVEQMIFDGELDNLYVH